MQARINPLAQLLGQLKELGSSTAVQGQREALVHLGQPLLTTSTIVLVAVMAPALPRSIGAPSAANDNREG